MTDKHPFVLVSDWEIRLVPSLQVGGLRLKYLENDTETEAEAHTSPDYAMHVDVMRKLARLLMQAADQLEASQKGH